MVIVKKREKAENLTGCDFKRFKRKMSGFIFEEEL